MNSIKCPECGLINWAAAINCKRCGRLFQPEASASNEAFGNDFGEQNFGAADEANLNAPTHFEPNFSHSRADNFNAVSQNQNYARANYQSPYQSSYGQNYKPASPKTGMAIASMVFGLVGCFFTAPVGLILGIVSLVKANRRPHEYGGKGFAIAGVVLNSFGVLFLPVIAAIAIPNLLAARRAANEASAIASVRTIHGAELTHMSMMAGTRCADLKTLGAANLIDAVLAKGEKSGYRFMVVSLPTINGGCEIHATPISLSHGRRSFYYSTEEGIMRAADKKGVFADANDAPFEGYDSFQQNAPPKISIRQRDDY